MMDVIGQLLKSDEPCIRFKVRVGVLGENPASASIKELREEIGRSRRVQALLGGAVKRDGRLYRPYEKWDGAHWVMASLADIGYPPGDEALVPWRQCVYNWLLSAEHERKVPCIEGRYRRCGSQEGNAVYYLLALGLADEGTDRLVRNLIKWQWPDGGWNCDKKPSAVNSSFHETLIPLRALALHARLTGNEESAAAAERAADIFLKRRMFRRQRDGSVIHQDFIMLHYPCYWHYDVLSGLKVMAEAGFISDERCTDALDLLESKRLSDGGWPAEKKYYRVSAKAKSVRELVHWGLGGRTRTNEFVTADALCVLKAAGRPA